jgi:hypothetical protein
VPIAGIHTQVWKSPFDRVSMEKNASCIEEQRDIWLRGLHITPLAGVDAL